MGRVSLPTGKAVHRSDSGTVSAVTTASPPAHDTWEASVNSFSANGYNPIASTIFAQAQADPDRTSALPMPTKQTIAYYAGTPGCRSGCDEPIDTCKPRPMKAMGKVLSAFTPSWLMKLTRLGKGQLLVKLGNQLGYFDPGREGQLRFDGQYVTVENPQTLVQAGGDDAFIEAGLLPLAAIGKETFLDENDEIQEREVIHHGVQQLREVDSGEIMGLQVDCVSGTVRIDKVEPEPYNLSTQDFQRFEKLGFRYERVTNGCAVSTVKKWFRILGFALAKDELVHNPTCVQEAVLLQRKAEGECDPHYVMGVQDVVDKAAVLETEQGDYYIEIAKKCTDDCGNTTKTKFLLPFPKALLSGEFDALEARVQALEDA